MKRLRKRLLLIIGLLLLIYICSAVLDLITAFGYTWRAGRLCDNGEFGQALVLAECAVTLQKPLMALPKPLRFNNLYAFSMMFIGVSKLELGDHSGALEAFGQANEVATKVSMKGIVLNDLAMTYWHLGMYTQGLETVKQFRDIPDEALRTELGDRPNLQWVLGEYKAMTYDTEALLRIEEGKYEEAKKSSEYAANLTYELHERAASGQLKIGTFLPAFSDENLNSLGNRSSTFAYVCARMGKPEEGLRHCERAVNLMQARKKESRLADVYDAMAVCHLSANNPDSAIAILDRAIASSSSLMRPHTLARLRARKGEALARKGLLSNSAREYVAAVELIERLRGLPSEVKQRMAIAGRWQEVYRGLIQVLMRLHEKGDKPEAPDLDARGESSAEVAFYYSEAAKARTMVELLGEAHARDINKTIPKEFADQEEQLRDRIKALRFQLNRATTDQAKVILSEIDAETKKLDGLVERMRNDKTTALYSAALYPRPARLKEIPLHADEALVEYQVTEDATYLWLVYQGKLLASQRIPISEKDLAEKVRQFREPFEVRDKVPDPVLSRHLWELLLSDAERLIPVPKLIIVPDGVLHLLPFEALARESEYVIDRWQISYYQSATVLALNRQLRAERSGSKPLLAVGDPVYDSKKDDRFTQQSQQNMAMVRRPGSEMRSAIEQGGRGDIFNRLKWAKAEVEEVGFQFGLTLESDDVLLGLKANEGELKRRNKERKLEEYRYLLFATHGVLDRELPGVMEPALVLSLVGDESGEDGYLKMSEIFGLKLSGAELVALSACQTALGEGKEPMAGEGMVGLTRAFMYAGTKSVLASLWKVNDKSTSDLMQTFFRHLKEGKGKAEALALAKRELRQEPGYSSPFHWAPFVLVGD